MNCRAFRPDYDVAGLARFKSRRLAQQVRVERAGQAFVGADNNDQLLFYLAAPGASG